MLDIKQNPHKLIINDYKVWYDKASKSGYRTFQCFSNKISRSFFFFMKGKQAYIVHIFQKKSQKTPKQNLELAMNRMKKLKQELENG
ncbi:type II toxin-antitoxin system RelE/ParE family toxin [Mannheimia sp. AT1]|uniref:Type II toxin-antitoxin system RelE/ParE family toxin n=1 Tax=Mannheimia cairinae TaxID=3025936 RepID=A0ABT5MR19_9PAST|nr:type II toxin-antitoxin system RelE/ParE family toxin [Mannheimia cairinae]MDD0823914.1 type II toxin-antitoxin system RelE/ParE family toxin [Mannheimia cairinae]MDD0825230.1 type II toxin-antitoxin system RelE/ParE family toxin [Mannheimia cairinae]